MNTLSYSITRENLNSGNYDSFKTAAHDTADAVKSCDLLLSVIFNILNTKEEQSNEED